MLERNIFDGTFWKNAFHLMSKIRPLVFAPKVVDHQESATLKIVSQSDHFCLGKPHVARFDNVDERVLEQFLIGELQNFPVWIRLDRSQLLEPIREIQVCVRIIGSPFASSSPSTVAVITVSAPSDTDERKDIARIGFVVFPQRNSATVIRVSVPATTSPTTIATAPKVLSSQGQRLGFGRAVCSTNPLRCGDRLTRASVLH